METQHDPQQKRRDGMAGRVSRRSPTVTDQSLYAAELRAAAGRADDDQVRQALLRTADRLTRDEDLALDELMLLSVAAIAVQTPDEMVSWGRSVARRHVELDGAIEVLLKSAGERWLKKRNGGAH